MSKSSDDRLQGLVCPECHSSLIRDGDFLVCSNPDSRLQFRIEDGIPHLLADQAASLTQEEWSAVLQRSESAERQK
ncbi:MAG: Trm112 family protein [Planctomycetaceae bacterium]|jgi:uncharacterized protein YbaR (Trm112 family)